MQYMHSNFNIGTVYSYLFYKGKHPINWMYRDSKKNFNVKNSELNRIILY